MPVYFIRAGVAGDVKIGTSNNPLSRLRVLQTSHPQRLRIVRVVEGGRPVERALHARFSDLRRAGEWFAFSDEMMSKDIGHADLPIPFPKRKGPGGDTPHALRSEMHDDMLTILGGPDAFARKLGVPPWEATDWRQVHRKFYSAAVVLLRLAGHHHVTVDLLWKMDEDIAASSAAAAKTRTDSDSAKRQAYQEKLWLKKHGRDAAWWALSPDPDEESEAAA